MCLAIPAQVREKTGENLAVVDVLGVTRTVSLDLVPDAGLGDWVLIHAGFAIEQVDEQFAKETIEILKSIPFGDDDTTLMGEAPVPFVGAVPSSPTPGGCGCGDCGCAKE